MNSFYKILFVFVVLFSALSSISIYTEWSSSHHVIFPLFFNKTHTRDYSPNKVYSDFSHAVVCDNFDNYGQSTGANNFEKYTAQDFQYHFIRIGYTESQILHQRCLYMHDAFVKYAQTYSGYKDAIQKLYAELKNLNLFQKTYRLAKGTYCKGLQDRISYLYKQLNTVKAITQDNNLYYASVFGNNSSAVSGNRIVCAEQFAEYKALESTYDAFTPCLAKAINKRSAICHNIERANKSYNLNNNIKQLLSRYGHELTPFIHCSGSQLQQVIHQESLDILQHIDKLPGSSVLYDHQEALVDFTVAMVDYNHAGLIDKAMTIGDLCWTLLDYGKAIAEGAALGVYAAASDILTNPIEATVSIVAGKQVLAYQLCKVLYNVADIGVTAISDYDGAKEKWNNMLGH